jgi:predicted dehydrogenase
VVEKPFTPTEAECNALIRLAREKRLLLTVFQNRRWDADFLTLQKVIADGSLGRVVEFESHFDRYDPEVPRTWAGKVQPGSGVVYDLGAHLFDQVLVLYGLPSKVTGFLGSQRAGNTQGLQDACTALLHYDNGMLVTVKASAVSPVADQLRYWVRGDLGSFRKVSYDRCLRCGYFVF